MTKMPPNKRKGTRSSLARIAARIGVPMASAAKRLRRQNKDKSHEQ
jgi:hypothetical protein